MCIVLEAKEADYYEGRQCDIIKLHDNENLLLMENFNEFDNFIWILFRVKIGGNSERNV